MQNKQFPFPEACVSCGVVTAEVLQAYHSVKGGRSRWDAAKDFMTMLNQSVISHPGGQV